MPRTLRRVSNGCCQSEALGVKSLSAGLDNVSEQVYICYVSLCKLS